jgi:hypothetical protein
MESLGKMVFILVIALVSMSFIMVIALIFVPGFSAIAPTVIAAVLGPLTTALSILGGILAASGISKAADAEVQQVQQEMPPVTKEASK